VPDEAPGVRESLGDLKSGLGRLVSAHRELLAAEIGAAVREAGIIAGLVGAAIVLALLALVLIYVGTFLFLGEWLFGSMGWGILHGVLFTICFIVPIGLNLAGGKIGAWVRALALSLVVGIILGVIFATNVLRNTAIWLGQQLQPSLNLEIGLLTWLVPALATGIVLGLLLGILGARGAGVKGFVGLLIAGLVFGFLVGGLLAYITFDTKGAGAIAVTVWLILWIVLSAVLAMRSGLDTKTRYDKLVPRESMAQFAATRAYLEQQWQRQRKKLVGR
jgi:hypothetical protein